MELQLVRNATMRLTYRQRVSITDPYLAPRHSQETLIGRSRNPLVDLPMPPEAVVVAIHMETFDFDMVSRSGLRALADAEGIEPERLLVPSDGETVEF